MYCLPCDRSVACSAYEILRSALPPYIIYDRTIVAEQLTLQVQRDFIQLNNALIIQVRA